MQSTTFPATYSKGVIIPSKEIDVNNINKIMITVTYNEIENKPVIRDEYGFTEAANIELQNLLDETDKGIGVSKPYYDVHTLFNDLDNNAVKY